MKIFQYDLSTRTAYEETVNNVILVKIMTISIKQQPDGGKLVRMQISEEVDQWGGRNLKDIIAEGCRVPLTY